MEQQLDLVSNYLDTVLSGHFNVRISKVLRPRFLVRVGQLKRRSNIVGGPKVMATVVEITDEEQVDVSYAAVDAAGNEESLPTGTTMTASVDNAGVCVATPSADGQSINIASENAVSGSSVGQAQVSVTITLPDGNTLNDVIAVNVTPSEPAQLVGTVGNPTPR